MRVLLVDDSAVARATARRLLERAGAAVVEASGAKEATSRRGERFDGAMLDLELGDGTGVEVFDALRADIGTAVFVTAAEDGPLLAEATSRATVFRKPAGVADAVEALLSRGRGGC